MAEATLRNMANDEDIVVPEEGLVFGRAGGDADVQIDDPSISRRQARVSFKMGTWVLETLAVPQGQRAPRPMPLKDGTSFFVGENEFEVVTLNAEEAEEEAAQAPAETPKPAPRPPGKAAPKPARAPAKTERVARKKEVRSESANESTSVAADSEGASTGFGSLFGAVPKGIAYYLVAVPKLLFNPMGTVRKSIDEMPMQAMGRNELIGYALPALLASLLLSSIAAGIAGLIAGGRFELSVLVPIQALVISVVVSIVLGFIFHPFWEWLIRLLEGKSDDRSRTNFFLLLMTVVAATAVPGILGTIFAAIPIRFIHMLGPLLMVVVSAFGAYAFFRWIVAFDVAKWARTGALVLCSVSVVFPLLGIVNSVRAEISSSSSAAPDIAEGEVEVAAEPTEPSEEAAGEANAPRRHPEKAARGKGSQEKKSAAAAEHKGEAQAPDDEPAPEPAASAEETNPAEGEAAEEPTKEARHPEKAAAAAQEPKPEAVAAPGEEAPTPAPASLSPYGAFALKRDAVERRLAANPVLLKNRTLQELYGKYLVTVSEIDENWAKKIQKEGKKARLWEYLRDAERFEKTSGQVDKLAAQLGIR